MQQALDLILLSKNKIITLQNALDYAAGHGSLAKILKNYFNISIFISDFYVQANDEDIAYISEKDLTSYCLVMNSAMFEHIIRRDTLDKLNNYVRSDGVLIINTIICENVPQNPNWSYLRAPVHCAFHTNKSMQILMNQWGYEASIYSPQSQSWWLFKKDYPYLDQLEHNISLINEELQRKYFHYKEGFMDYWKTF